MTSDNGASRICILGGMTSDNGASRICILGGGGFLGQNLAQALQRNGHFVVLLDLQFARVPNVVLDKSKLLFLKASILERESLRQALKGCTACFHLAAYGMSKGASLNRDMNWLVNVRGTQLVLDECKRAGVERLIYTSTVTVVVGGEEVHHLDESAPYLENFMSAYAESKCQAEQLILKANRDALQTCVLRLRGLYGPGDQTCCKRTLDICKSGMLQARFEKSEPNLSQYLSVGNCVQALSKAEETLRDKQSPACGRPYFIVDGGEPIDSMGFWKPLIEAAGGRLPTIKVPFVLVYLVAWILEWAYHLFGIEPLMTRMELCLCAITNTYSIEAARRDFGYNPVNNHDLGETVKWATAEVQAMRNAKTSAVPSKMIAFESQVKRLFGVLAMVAAFVSMFLVLVA